MLLTGCDKKENANLNNTNNNEKDNTQEIEKDNITFDISGNYKLAYKKIIQNSIVESKSGKWDNITYMLIDIDGNTVPELLVYYQGCGACTKIDYYTLDGSEAISLGSTSNDTIIYEKNAKYFTGITGQGYDVISELSINNKKIVATSVVEGKQLTPEHSKVDNFQKDLKRINFKKLSDFEYMDEVDPMLKGNDKIVGTYFALDEEVGTREWWIFNSDGTWERQASVCAGYARYNGIYTLEKYKGNDTIKVSYEKYTVYLKVEGDKITVLESDIKEGAGDNSQNFPYDLLIMGGCSYIGETAWQKNSRLSAIYETPGWEESPYY